MLWNYYPEEYIAQALYATESSLLTMWLPKNWSKVDQFPVEQYGDEMIVGNREANALFCTYLANHWNEMVTYLNGRTKNKVE